MQQPSDQIVKLLGLDEADFNFVPLNYVLIKHFLKID